MAINKINQILSTLPSPLYKENTTNLTVTETVTFNGVLVNAETIEIVLQFSPRLLQDNSSGLKTSRSVYSPTNISTGVYQQVIPAIDFSNPGTYSILVRATDTIGGFITVKSDDFVVLDKNQSDQFNVLSDSNVSQLVTLQEEGSVSWKTLDITGAQIKAKATLVNDNVTCNGMNYVANLHLADLNIGDDLVAVGVVVKTASTLGSPNAENVFGLIGNDALMSLNCSIAFNNALNFVDIAVPGLYSSNRTPFPIVSGKTALMFQIAALGSVGAVNLSDLNDNFEMQIIIGTCTPIVATLP